MLKVIVADDERRVCQLIIKLIDWEELGMVVVGVASNGVEAIDLIRIHNPDLIITDIRMPGYDGLEMIVRAKKINNNLEFIIISGYGQFEYAQKAIRYGVSDYLLKPIKKDELTQTLIKIKESIRRKKGQLSIKEQYEIVLKNNIDRKREGLLNEFSIYDPDVNKVQTIDEVNHDYYFNFKSGYFQVFAIKIDSNSKAYINNQDVIEKKVETVVDNAFQDITYDLETSFMGSTCYSIINHSFDNKNTIHKQFRSILQELTRQDVILREMEVTIGLGKRVEAINGLHESFETATWSIEERIVKGTRRIIEDGIPVDNNLTNSELLHSFNTLFLRAVEKLNTQEVIKTLNSLKSNLKDQSTLNGHQVLHVIKEICSLYVFTMRKNKLPIENGDSFLGEFNDCATECNSIDQVFDQLSKVVVESLEKVMDERVNMNTKPIRLAKEYIDKNYMKNITLEDLGKIIGFNPTYFSSLFKKETGASFTEYLLDVRIKQAKELLKELDLRVSDICEMVGYSDVKYFTKLFTKHTGLKPNEYRRIYS